MMPADITAETCPCCGHPADGEKLYDDGAYDEYEHDRRTFGLCWRCLHKLWLKAGDEPPTNEDFLAFIIGRLRVDLARYQSGRVIGRCQAVDAFGRQCGNQAFARWTGRGVCKPHMRDGINFVCAETYEPYGPLIVLISGLLRADPEFDRALRKSVATVEVFL